MCYKTNCRNCKKATWDGCGMHVSSALAGVSMEDRCPNWKMGARKPCAPDQTMDTSAPAPASQATSSWWPFGSK